MENKFTQGEWEVASVDYVENTKQLHVLVKGKGGLVCTLFHLSGASSVKEEAEANAKLIAAAPDMLEALNDLVEHIVSVLPFGKQDIKKILAAKQAIKKATE